MGVSSSVWRWCSLRDGIVNRSGDRATECELIPATPSNYLARSVRDLLCSILVLDLSQ